MASKQALKVMRSDVEFARLLLRVAGDLGEPLDPKYKTLAAAGPTFSPGDAVSEPPGVVDVEEVPPARPDSPVEADLVITLEPGQVLRLPGGTIIRGSMEAPTAAPGVALSTGVPLTVMDEGAEVDEADENAEAESATRRAPRSS